MFLCVLKIGGRVETQPRVIVLRYKGIVCITTLVCMGDNDNKGTYAIDVRPNTKVGDMV